MKSTINEDNLNRLAVSIMQNRNCKYEEAVSILISLKLCLICSEDIKDSVPLQSALLTAVNTGKRAFLGKVTVVLQDENIKSLISGASNEKLSNTIVELGASLSSEIEENATIINIGNTNLSIENSLQIFCNNWQAGVLNIGEKCPFTCSGNSPLAGIAAGALGVGIAFFSATSISPSSKDNVNGISLWRPDLDWLDKNAVGPELKFLPEKFWLLGLGHLGQGYLWSIGMLPYPISEKPILMLQDNDKITEANWSSGLLTEKEDKRYKTRVCASWLERRNFKTFISERRFDDHCLRQEGEPFVALCGFDNGISRTYLEKSGFSFIVENALGGSLDLFDNIIFHTFPNSYKKPPQIWSSLEEKQDEFHEIVLKEFSSGNEIGCDMFARSLASKAISSSFVGAFTGALTIAELVRALHGGNRYDTIVIHIRALHHRKVFLHQAGNAMTEMSINGFIEIK